VIRAWTSDGSVTRNAPVDIAGVPVAPAPPVPATSTSSEHVSVRAHVVDRSSAWSAAFGGPLSRDVVVEVRNDGASATPPLQLGGGVGRERGGGDPFSLQKLAPVAPGATRVVTIPITIGGPSWGGYVAYGTLFGLDKPVVFSEETSTDPWALELVIPVLLLAYAQVLRRRERRGRAARAELAATEHETPERVIDLTQEQFPERSPDVGEAVGGRCGSPPYAPDRWSHEPVPSTAAPSDSSGGTEHEGAAESQLTSI
jgi:hypothetical protein